MTQLMGCIEETCFKEGYFPEHSTIHKRHQRMGCTVLPYGVKVAMIMHMRDNEEAGQ